MSMWAEPVGRGDQDDQVDEQIRRLEQRLTREGHAVAPDVVHEWVEEVRRRFVGARVQVFVPMLMERELRSRLRSADHVMPAGDSS